jgi:KipI family sensor histidine kinase inhibitor
VELTGRPPAAAATSGVRIMPCGDRGLLVELDSLEEALALYRTLRRRRLPGLAEMVPAARTVLLELTADADPAELARAVRGTPLRTPQDHEDDLVTIPVVYDGEDLAAVAEMTRRTVPEVVRLHTSCEWTVAFGGFSPGFGYLTGGPEVLRVPRRAESRVRVPVGSVGLAGEFSGVYPRQSPGGWQLIGRTEHPVWREDREPPALLRPGVRVRFEAVDG